MFPCRVVPMEQTFQPLEVRRRDPNLIRLTQAGLLIASLGAVLIVFNPLGLAVAGLVLAAVGAVLAARGGLGHAWYFAVAGGAALAILSRLIAEGSETFGGWLAVIACVAILFGATLGFPDSRAEPA
jgi:hypothetical protein